MRTPYRIVTGKFTTQAGNIQRPEHSDPRSSAEGFSCSVLTIGQRGPVKDGPNDSTLGAISGVVFVIWLLFAIPEVKYALSWRIPKASSWRKR